MVFNYIVIYCSMRAIGGHLWSSISLSTCDVIINDPLMSCGARQQIRALNQTNYYCNLAANKVNKNIDYKLCLIGDGICDDQANNPWCFYDFGDCCKKDSYFGWCEECRCEVKPQGQCPAIAFVGDGNCDPFSLTEDCLYDGGDCYK